MKTAFAAGLAGASCSRTEPQPGAERAQVQIPKRLKAFCVDFNWQPFDWTEQEQGDWPNRFAKPGVWADASPREHVAWYKALGANVMQTFAVSCNGYAWYKSDLVPPQPGLRHDFLKECVKLGHDEGLMVMGYFAISMNTRLAQENPRNSYGAPSANHTVLTDGYLDFLTASMEDAIARTDLDGFMTDMVWQPDAKLREDGWIDSDKALYEQLMKKPFPASGAPAEEDRIAYDRAAIDRAWKKIHSVTKKAKPAATIWLSCNDPSRPEVIGSDLLKQIDWSMNENPRTELLNAAKESKGADTRLLQCLVGWPNHDPQAFVSDPANDNIDLYGFARPRRNSLPLPIEEYLSKPVVEFQGETSEAANDRNIAILARYYNGLPFDAVVPKTS